MANRSSQDHRNYKVRGRVTKRKIKRTQAKSGPKGRPGYSYSAPWVCPNPEFHTGVSQ